VPTISPVVRGTAFSLERTYRESGTPINLTTAGITATAIVRTPDGSWGDTLTVTLANQSTHPGEYYIGGDTTAWPVGRLLLVTAFTHSGSPRGTFMDYFTLLEAPASSGSGGGGSGSAEPYVHTQSIAAAEWIVNHNLGHRPAGVEVLSPGGLSVTAEIVHMSVNQLRVYFSDPQTGSVLAL
jgi:hypothetical protein